VSRRERIAFLLAHYSDVLAGVRDRGLGGDHLPLMCSAWNHPSYQELERLLPLLGYDMRRLYRAVMGTYVYPRFVCRAVCPRCGLSRHRGTSASFTGTTTAASSSSRAW
jgi:hypothetical protein